jgi:thiamine biosynthesis protein ThiI
MTVLADTVGWRELPWDAVAVHFAELALKGMNRGEMTARLRRNLQRALGRRAARVSSHHDHLLVEPAAGQLGAALTAAAGVMGVAYVQPLRRLPAEESALAGAALELYRALAGGRWSFAVRARGLSRVMPVDSPEIERRLGRAIIEATGAPVELVNPQVCVRLRAYERSVCLLGPRMDGPGGLPLGVQGAVLTMFSGGIDSPVAAWLMMRRGCWVDFLHVHTHPDPEAVRASKIVGLIEQLLRPQGISARLFLVPYDVFQVGLLSGRAPRGLEMTLFRRFVARVADKLAAEHHHQALVTGDNLGQVASQTLENLAAVDDAVARPVFRPLLTYDKREIIALAGKLGTYALSIRAYKDCCSLVARQPATRPKLAAVRAVEATLDVEGVVERAVAETVYWRVGEDGGGGTDRGTVGIGPGGEAGGGLLLP